MSGRTRREEEEGGRGEEEKGRGREGGGRESGGREPPKTSYFSGGDDTYVI